MYLVMMEMFVPRIAAVPPLDVLTLPEVATTTMLAQQILVIPLRLLVASIHSSHVTTTMLAPTIPVTSYKDASSPQLLAMITMPARLILVLLPLVAYSPR
jgi:hypothetical protein